MLPEYGRLSHGVMSAKPGVARLACWVSETLSGQIPDPVGSGPRPRQARSKTSTSAGADEVISSAASPLTAAPSPAPSVVLLRLTSPRAT